MIRRTALIFLIAAFTASLAGDADAKTKPRKRIAQPAAAPWSTPASQQPAGMIEVKPGVWVSSYGCISDEGYGRYRPCDLNSSGGH